MQTAMTTVAMIGNGDFVPCASLLNQYHSIIALDGGLAHCRRLGITPTHSLGDGDSMTTAPRDFIHLSDQTDTDLQKGLTWIRAHLTPPYQIDLFSMTSHERLDHTLQALYLAATNPEISTIYTPKQELRFVRNQLTLVLPLASQLAIVNFGPMASTIGIIGCQWSGDHIVLDQTTAGISNRVTAPVVTITVHIGSVYVITAAHYG